MPLTRTQARKILLAMKDTEERSHFGQPSVFFAGKLVGRVHDKEEAVALRIGSIEMRDVMIEAEPRLFYITDHYRPWPMLLARLKVLDTKTLKELARARIGEIEAGTKKRGAAKTVEKKTTPKSKTRPPAKRKARTQ